MKRFTGLVKLLAQLLAHSPFHYVFWKNKMNWIELNWEGLGSSHCFPHSTSSAALLPQLQSTWTFVGPPRNSMQFPPHTLHLCDDQQSGRRAMTENAGDNLLWGGYPEACATSWWVPKSVRWISGQVASAYLNIFYNKTFFIVFFSSVHWRLKKKSNPHVCTANSEIAATAIWHKLRGHWQLQNQYFFFCLKCFRSAWQDSKTISVGKYYKYIVLKVLSKNI